MGLGLRRRQRGSEGASTGPVEALPEYFDSNLLALLFEPFEEGARLRVLDLGPGSPRTVAFLSRYSCRLHCADLYDEPELLGACEPEQETERVRRLRGALGITDGVTFDVCLFWDLLRFIHPDALRMLGLALAPAVGPRTLAHGFLYHGRAQSGQQAWPARAFGLESPQRASQRIFGSGRLTPGNLPQRQVLELLGGFAVDKSRLLQGGLLEVVLEGEPA